MSTHKEYALIAILATAAIVGVGPAFGDNMSGMSSPANNTQSMSGMSSSANNTQGMSGMTSPSNSMQGMSGSNTTTVQPIIIPVTLPFSLTTDKTTYDRQSTVLVTGHVQNIIPGMPVTLRVSDSLGNVVEVDQLTVDNSGNFQTKINTSSPLWTSGGTYTIYGQYGMQQGMRTTQTQFSIGGGGGVSSCQPNQLAATVNNEMYCINYSISGGTATGATLSMSSKTLTVNLQATSDGQITLQIPRSVLDAKSGVKDDSFFVLVDGEEKDSFTDTPSADTRTLTIPFNMGAAQIQIIGTQIVPEFGPIAALVLAIAIISIIAVSAKTGLRFMPKY